MIESVAPIPDPASAFLEVACVPRHSGYSSGTVEHAEMILSRYSLVAGSNIYTAAVLADETRVRAFLAVDPKNATAKGGPHGWDALTYLCFSRYLRLDRSRSEAFVRTAQALLEAGASAKTGWIEMIDHPWPRPVFESALYGAAALARHPELTRLLLAYGADPNDEETPYHVPEGYDNTVLNILLASGELNESSLATILVRKADWHDEEGIRLALASGANPNFMTRWGANALQHALRLDNALAIIDLLLDHGADVALKNIHEGRTAAVIAARRGRGDVLAVLAKRGVALGLEGLEKLIAACAQGDRAGARLLAAQEPHLGRQLQAQAGTLLAEFAGNNNVAGLQCFFDLGVDAALLYKEGDGYFDIAKDSTALHVAAWRAWPETVRYLIEQGTPVNALDGKGRTALALAVKACVDSYWTHRRSPDSVKALLSAGATVTDIEIPSGYEPVDELLRRY